VPPHPNPLPQGERGFTAVAEISSYASTNFYDA
jgi:hypothetical protein